MRLRAKVDAIRATRKFAFESMRSAVDVREQLYRAEEGELASYVRDIIERIDVLVQRLDERPLTDELEASLEAIGPRHSIVPDNVVFLAGAVVSKEEKP